MKIMMISSCTPVGAAADAAPAASIDNREYDSDRQSQKGTNDDLRMG